MKVTQSSVESYMTIFNLQNKKSFEVKKVFYWKFPVPDLWRIVPAQPDEQEQFSDGQKFLTGL